MGDNNYSRKVKGTLFENVVLKETPFMGFIFHKLMEWTIEKKIDDAVEKVVVIVALHTSWQDFNIGAFNRKLINT